MWRRVAFTRVVVLTGAVWLALSGLGCTGAPADAPTLHPVKGTLKKGGQPLKGVTVTFMPVGGAGQSAVGNTSDDGSFVLATPNAGEGAVAGKYNVVLSVSAAAVDESAYTSESGAPPAAAPGESALPFPKAYTDPKTSPKTVEVTEGENTIDIDI